MQTMGPWRSTGSVTSNFRIRWNRRLSYEISRIARRATDHSRDSGTHLSLVPTHFGLIVKMRVVGV